MTRSTPIWNAARLAALRARGDDGSPAEVIAVNREILELDPHDMAAANRLGRALQDSGDLHGALAVFRAALERHPDNQIAARRIKDITGHIPPGRSRPRTEQRSPRMRPATDAELVEHRRQAEGLWTVAEAVQVCSDYRQSRHDPRIAVIYGEWATTLDQRNAVAWTARAAAHRNARQVTEAVSAAQESVTLEPDVGRNPHGHTTLLAALVDSGPPPQDLTERLEALAPSRGP